MDNNLAMLSMATPAFIPRLDLLDRDNIAEVGAVGTTRRAVWHIEESLVLLDVIRNGNFVGKICDKNAKKSYLFEELSTQLGEQNIFRNAKQVECHWKHLRRTYFQLKQRIDEEGISEDATRIKWEPYIFIKSIFDSASDPEFLMGRGNIEYDDSCIKFETESIGGSPSDPFGSLQDTESESGCSGMFVSSLKAPIRERRAQHIPQAEIGTGSNPLLQDPNSSIQSCRKTPTADIIHEESNSVNGSHHRQAKRRRLNATDSDTGCDERGSSAQTSDEDKDVNWSNMLRYEKALMDRQEKYIEYMEKVRADELERDEKRVEESRDWQIKLMNLQFQHQREMVQSIMSSIVEIAKIFTSKP